MKPLRLAALGLVAAAAPAAAQDRLTARVTVAVLEHRALASPSVGVERSNGALLGGALLYQASTWLTVELETWMAALRGRSEGAIDHDVAQVSLNAGIPAATWLIVDGGVRLRAYSSPVARQRWTMLRVGAEARLEFLGGSVAGIARLHYLPSVTVRGLGAPDVAVAAAAGMDYRLGPTTLRVLYDLERVDFPERNGTQRLEQLSGLSLTLGMALGRSP